MLAQRIITAIALFAIIFAAAAASTPVPLLLFIALASAACLWEWLRLTLGTSGRVGVPFAVGVVFAAMATLALLKGGHNLAAVFPQTERLRYFMMAVSAFWVVGAGWAVYNGDTTRNPYNIIFSLFGMAAVFATWLSLSVMFITHGAWFLVSFMALVWCADIGAFFFGRAIGGPKLAPRVSPGKTWSGAVGGVIASLAWLFISSVWPGSFGAALLQAWPVWLVGLLGIGLTALSIVGDLFESLLKRRANTKDSSGLLPGHGGFFDRTDALLPVAPLVYLVMTGLLA